MRSLSNAGRIFYSIAITSMGILTIYYKDFPYMLIPPEHSWITNHVLLTYFFGALLILCGACIAFEKKTRTISLLLGSILLLIFCFYFIPYEFIATSNYMHLVEWENAEKELALSAGAFIVAGIYSRKDEKSPGRFLRKLISLGPIFFSITIISFGILHFLYTKEASTLVPSWISNPMFWTYFAGTALIGSGLGIILKIKRRQAAILLGTMIFTWFIILHIPRVIVAPATDIGDEITSALLALAYSGIAFVITGIA